MIIAITGLTNAGKSTLAKFLIMKGYKPVIEYTTRPIRDGEKDGIDYHFVNDEEFDKIAAAGEFAETLYVKTKHGMWKYGAKKEDLKDDHLLVCGPKQMGQLLDSGIPMLSVLLNIHYATAKHRAKTRGTIGDSLEEFDRRFKADDAVVDQIWDRMDMILDATNTTEMNAIAITRRLSREKQGLKTIKVHGQEIAVAQEMSENEVHLYLEGISGLKPYLRMRDVGMPKDPVNQIAWLLLQGGSCGFCKVCRDKPCNIKDGEKCTTNIADYIRECVHAEDTAKNEEANNG